MLEPVNENDISWAEPEPYIGSDPLKEKKNSLKSLVKLGFSVIDAVQSQEYPIGECIRVSFKRIVILLVDLYICCLFQIWQETHNVTATT